MGEKLIASDYDGTFYRHDKQDMENNLMAVKLWREQENLFVFSTGRDLGNLMYEKGKNKLEYDYLVALNGALVVDRNNEVIVKESIPSKLAAEIVDLMMAKVGEEIQVLGAYGGCNQTNIKATGERALELLERNRKIYLDSVESALEKEVLSVGCLNESFESAKRLQKEILNKYGDKIEVFVNLNYINIVQKGVSKASGLDAVIDHAGLERGEVYVIGDDLNDIPMIKKYRGSAVSNAKEEVKEMAGKVYGSVSEFITYCLNE